MAENKPKRTLIRRFSDSPDLKVTAISAQKHASDLEANRRKTELRDKVRKILECPSIQKLYAKAKMAESKIAKLAKASGDTGTCEDFWQSESLYSTDEDEIETEEKKELPKKAKGEDRYAELLAYLEGLERDLRDPTPQNLEAIRAAAVEIARSRPSKKEETTKTRTNRTQKKGGNEGTRTHLSKQETLRKILDVIIVDWAENKGYEHQ